LLVEDRSIIIARENFHTILERFNSKFLKEDGLGVSNFLTCFTNFELLDDFNLTLKKKLKIN
jgi:hypothetical protein